MWKESAIINDEHKILYFVDNFSTISMSIIYSNNMYSLKRENEIGIFIIKILLRVLLLMYININSQFKSDSILKL